MNFEFSQIFQVWDVKSGKFELFDLSQSTLVKQIGDEFFPLSYFASGSILILRFRPKPYVDKFQPNHFLSLEMESQGELKDLSLFSLERVNDDAEFATINNFFVVFASHFSW